MGSYMEIFEARVLRGNLYYIRGLHSVQSGVLPVYTQDTILKIGDFSTKN
jgi:hypothetical protein